MQEQGKFVIKEPCHEDWAAMTPKEQGRFCDVCAKCVVDLTNKSHDQILDAYKENEGDMCGRMTVSQLRTAKQTQPNKQPQRTRWFIPAATLKRIQIFAAAFVAIFAFLFTRPVQAQKHHVKGKMAYVKEVGKVSGNVKYDYGSAAAGLDVKLIRNSGVVDHTTTDAEGNYEFSGIRTGEYTITVSAYDWNMAEKPVTISAKKGKSVNFVVIDEAIDGGMELEPEIEILEMVEPVEEELPPIKIERTMLMGDVAYVPANTEEPVIEGPEEVTEPSIIDPEPPVIKSVCLAYTPNIPTEGSETAISNSTSVTKTETSQSLENSSLTTELQLTLYPNPTRGKLSGQVEMKKRQALEVVVLDLQGRVLISRTIGRQAKGAFSIDLSKYANGIYVLKVAVGEAIAERRIVKAE